VWVALQDGTTLDEDPVMIDPNNLARTATLVFGDEFDALSFWNGGYGWDYRPGWHVAYNPDAMGFNAGENETWLVNPHRPEMRAAAPFSVNNGVLTITAKPTDPAVAAYAQGHPYTSGQITSYHAFATTYGYFEMRAKLPAGAGLGAAFWLLSTDLKQPPELDIMESIGRDPTVLYNFVHSGDRNAQHIGQHTNANGPIYTAATWSRVPDLSAGFHTYGMNWQADRITCYLDGKKMFEMLTPADAHKPMYILAGAGISKNLWTGVAGPNTSGQMQIDHIRAYADGAPEPPNGRTITGTNGRNTLKGTALDDTIYGRGGNDLIHGRGGNDTLIGGGGADAFIFDKAPRAGNMDKIVHFARNDEIRLENSVFKALKSTGHPSASIFQLDWSDDANDYLWYQRSSGTLYYDPDGNGRVYPIPAITLANKPVLTRADILII
jgi:beta-glucanase (GH16 family)